MIKIRSLIFFTETFDAFFALIFRVCTCGNLKKRWFLKNEKKFVKNMKNWPFSGDVFCSFQCRKRIKMKSISDPHFLVVCFWTFLRTETENSRSLEMRVKRVPPFDFFGQNLFLTLLSNVDVKKSSWKSVSFIEKYWVKMFQNWVKMKKNGLLYPMILAVLRQGNAHSWAKP